MSAVAYLGKFYHPFAFGNTDFLPSKRREFFAVMFVQHYQPLDQEPAISHLV